eukprot:TRINITY_DN5976_c2_g1_i1.p1 TRINITY_DN5976_c2_g1~~TRINITY_DN5976_c2_g1_i1.p1  ORF type:complete len:965 (+),score=292.52 TRINITY_DN5976_c2_g1_i1:156-3050(+)
MTHVGASVSRVAGKAQAPQTLVEGVRSAESAKVHYELEYLKNLLFRHGDILDEKLYYLAKSYTQRHRIQLKHRKGERKRAGLGKFLCGVFDHCVVLSADTVLLIGSELPTKDTVDLRLPFLHETRRFSTGTAARYTLELTLLDAGSDLSRYTGQTHGAGKWEEVPNPGDEEMQVTCRQRVGIVLENPFSSPLATCIFVVQVILILLSVVALLVESIPAYNPEVFPEFKDVWLWIELVVTVVFTVETGVRFIVSDSKCEFVRRPTNVADILAIIPFYLDLVTSALGVKTNAAANALKICRLLRMLKFFRNFAPIENLVRALEKSAQALLAPMLFLVACLLVMSSMMYYVEKGEYDAEKKTFMIRDNLCESKPRHMMAVRDNMTEAICPKLESKFLSIPHTIWWSIVTMTTVGYGDMAPITYIGKVVGSASMVLGIMFMAMPIAIVGSYFTVVVDINAQKKIMRKTGLGGDMGGSVGPSPAASVSHARALDSTMNSMSRRHPLMLSPSVGSMAAPSSPRASPRAPLPKQEILDALRRKSTVDGLGPGAAAQRVQEVEAGLPGREGNSGATFGERLSMFLARVMPEHGGLWVRPEFVHHLDIWLDTHVPEQDCAEGRQRGAGRRVRVDTVMGVPTFGCMELLGQDADGDGGGPPKTVWLVRPMSFSVGSHCDALTDPDIVLSSAGASTSRHARVAQRNSEIVVKRWWSDKPLCLFKPTLPSRPTVNGDEVPPHGVILKHNDTIDFSPDCPSDQLPIRYRFRMDKYRLALENREFELPPDRLAELRGDSIGKDPRLRTLSDAHGFASPAPPLPIAQASHDQRVSALSLPPVRPTLSLGGSRHVSFGPSAVVTLPSSLGSSAAPAAESLLPPPSPRRAHSAPDSPPPLVGVHCDPQLLRPPPLLRGAQSPAPPTSPSSPSGSSRDSSEQDLGSWPACRSSPTSRLCTPPAAAQRSLPPPRRELGPPRLL